MKKYLNNFPFFIGPLLSIFLFFSFISCEKGNVNTQWKAAIEQYFQSSSLEQKLAQLFIVRVQADGNKEYMDSIFHLIDRYQPGGFIVFRGSLNQQKKTVAQIRKRYKLPALITTDAEWGIGMRAVDVKDMPFAMTLGAVQDIKLVEKVGKAIGEQLNFLGIDMNFAPVVDINTNPKNPIIGSRSFGSDKSAVTQRAMAYFEGLQQSNILAVAKHFPGHGDTHKDSHITLPVLNHSKERIQDIELFPYKALIKKGIHGLMLAHIYMQSFDQTDTLPATLSKNIIHTLLRKKMGFKGLIITDAMEMKAIVNYFNGAKSDLMSLKAGADMLLLPADFYQSIHYLIASIKNGSLNKKMIEDKYKKILTFKYQHHLHQKHEDRQDFDTQDEVQWEALKKRHHAIQNQVSQAAITHIASLPPSSIPELFKGKNPLILSFTNQTGIKENYFQQELSSQYQGIKTLLLSTQNESMSEKKVDELIKKANPLILSIHDQRDILTQSYPFHAYSRQRIKAMEKAKAIFFFSSPYIIQNLLKGKHSDKHYIFAYQNSWYMQDAAIKLSLGHISPKGKLPVDINLDFTFGMGN